MPLVTVAVPDDHRGNPIDFLQSVLADADQRARQYLAPGIYANVASLRTMLGLPKPEGSFNLGSYPIEENDQRVVYHCVARVNGQEYWMQVVVAPTGNQWLITEATLLSP